MAEKDKYDRESFLSYFGSVFSGPTYIWRINPETQEPKYQFSLSDRWESLDDSVSAESSVSQKVRKRRRGMGIIDMSEGVLVVAMDNGLFTLPGGGAEWYETRKQATKREIKEETSLDAINLRFFQKGIGPVYIDRHGRPTQNYNKVFVVDTFGGELQIGNEIKYYDFWKPGKVVNISPGTKKTLEKYFAEKA
jgi:hypothetical protein